MSIILTKATLNALSTPLVFLVVKFTALARLVLNVRVFIILATTNVFLFHKQTRFNHVSIIAMPLLVLNVLQTKFLSITLVLIQLSKIVLIMSRLQAVRPVPLVMELKFQAEIKSVNLCLRSLIVWLFLYSSHLSALLVIMDTIRMQVNVQKLFLLLNTVLNILLKIFAASVRLTTLLQSIRSRVSFMKPIIIALLIKKNKQASVPYVNLDLSWIKIRTVLQ